MGVFCAMAPAAGRPSRPGWSPLGWWTEAGRPHQEAAMAYPAAPEGGGDRGEPAGHLGERREDAASAMVVWIKPNGSSGATGGAGPRWRPWSWRRRRRRGAGKRGWRRLGPAEQRRRGPGRAHGEARVRRRQGELERPAAVAEAARPAGNGGGRARKQAAAAAAVERGGRALGERGRFGERWR